MAEIKWTGDVEAALSLAKSKTSPYCSISSIPIE